MIPLFDPADRGSGGTRTKGPSIDISSLCELDRAIPIRGFAIKYVTQGTERYVLNGSEHQVHADQYLLANQCCTSHVRIEDERPVKGICIELTSRIMDEVANGWIEPEADANPQSPSFFTGQEFPEGTRRTHGTRVGAYLQGIARALDSDPSFAGFESLEAYYALAECVLRDEYDLVARVRSIRAVRPGTRKDLYRRVQRAKAFMEADLYRPLSLQDMAREAAMSSYHFLRAFTWVEGVSPYRYRLHLRLDAAHRALLHGCSVQDAAMQGGFIDAPGFSKAFKGRFAHSPMDLLNGSRKI